jgi:hypothetical protein
MRGADRSRRLFLVGDLSAPRAACFRPVACLSLRSADSEEAAGRDRPQAFQPRRGHQAARGGPLHRPGALTTTLLERGCLTRTVILERRSPPT